MLLFSLVSCIINILGFSSSNNLNKLSFLVVIPSALVPNTFMLWRRVLLPLPRLVPPFFLVFLTCLNTTGADTIVVEVEVEVVVFGDELIC